MVFTRKHNTDIDAYLQEETKCDNILGLFTQVNAPKVLSRIGNINQRHNRCLLPQR